MPLIKKAHLYTHRPIYNYDLYTHLHTIFIMTLTTTNATNKGPTKNVQTNLKPNNTKYILKVSMR
jgi:hypothetical protein